MLTVLRLGVAVSSVVGAGLLAPSPMASSSAGAGPAAGDDTYRCGPAAPLPAGQAPPRCWVGPADAHVLPIPVRQPSIGEIFARAP